ncbi:hypothetical protein N8988_03775 [Opitutales bacterium]|nr:hypothetical protein [Opitutales bacterium]
MKKTNFSITPIFLAVFFSFTPSVFAQDGSSGGGGETSAEASVTTSSSKKSAAAPETIESNPVVTVVKSGLPIQAAILIPVDSIIKIAEEGGSLANLKVSNTYIVSAQSRGEDIATFVSHAVTAIDSGISFTSSSGQGFMDVAEGVSTGDFSIDEIATIKTNLDAGVDLSVQASIGVTAVKTKYLDKGLSSATINSQFIGKSGDALAAAVTATDEIATAVATGQSESDAIKVVNSGGDAGTLGFINQVNTALADNQSAKDALTNLSTGFIASANSNGDNIFANDTVLQNSFLDNITFFADVSTRFTQKDYDLLTGFITAKNANGSYLHDEPELQVLFKSITANSVFLELAHDILLIKDNDNYIYSQNAPLQEALTASFAVFSSTFIKDFTGANAISGVDAENKLPVEINFASLTAEGGYTPEIIKLLVSYGAIGTKGDELAEKLGFEEGSTITGFLGTVTDGTSTLNEKTATSDFFSLLTTLTGDADLGDPDGDNDGFLDISKNSVLNVSRDDVTLSPGSKITFGETGSKITTTVDVSDKLPPATNNNSANKSDPDRKIYVIGSSKDMTIASDVTFTNSNDVEDHALTLGSADDLYFRSEYNTANKEDYNDPTPINLTYTGSNLGLGSEDTMRLVNVNITTGGNLAIGTLKDLHIGLQDGHMSTFSVGTGGKNSDPDNVYLYANNLLDINGLQFAGRVDDVYMDAITINLKNVSFPNTSEVMARSQHGTINSGTGSVNFLGNVKHGNDLISGAKGGASNEFNGIDGHWDLNKKLENGKSAFVIRKR